MDFIKVSKKVKLFLQIILRSSSLMNAFYIFNLYHKNKLKSTNKY